MAEPIRLAIVGHTNAGKTSLLRTLTRHANFGEVSARPGTTRHVEAIEFHVDGESMVRFFDTPGLEDSAALIETLKSLNDHLTPPERIRAFLDSAEAQQQFEQEAKVLRTMLDVDAAMYVVDTREPDLPKFRYEIEVLAWCGKPLMPVLNFVRGENSRKEMWRSILSAYNLHTYVEFDAVAPFVGSEVQLFSDLIVLLRRREGELRRVVKELEKQREQRRQAACRLIAETLVSLAALRRSINKEDFADPDTKEAFINDFQNTVATRIRRSMEDLLAIYGFRKEEAEPEILSWLSGQWENTLFDPASLQEATKRLGSGAAVGMAVGLIADIALAGLTLGTGTALGATLGGLGNQNWRHFARKTFNKVFHIEEMILQNEVLLLAAEHLLRLVAVLEQRGHAAASRIALQRDSAQAVDEKLKTVLVKLQPARSHPEWETANVESGTDQLPRMRLIDETAVLLQTFVKPA